MKMATTSGKATATGDSTRLVEPVKPDAVLGRDSVTARVKISCGRVVVRLAPDTTAWMSLFDSKYKTESTRGLSMRGLADLAADPPVMSKDTSPVAVPFYSSGKTGKHARNALFGVLVVDLDDGNLSEEQVREQLGGLRYVAYMSSSTAGKQKWKVAIPYSKSIGVELHVQISEGVCRVMGGDAAQARIAQVFHLPIKLKADSHYAYINTMDDEGCEWLDPEGDSEFLQYALIAWEEWEAERLAKQQKATPKPCDGLSEGDKGVIGKINNAYTFDELMEDPRYIRVGDRWLRDGSLNPPGVCLLPPDADGVVRLFSHHGEDCQLSALNHDNHSHDVASVLCELVYGGDLKRMIAAEAVILDPKGQKERQREHMREKDRARLDPSLTDGIDVRPPDIAKLK